MYLLIWMLMSICLHAVGQNRPFPQNVNYPHGFQPSTITSQDAKAAYDKFAAENYVSCGNGQWRVKFNNPNQTVSEGIGWAMVLTAYYGDRSKFDGFWAYYQRWSNDQGLMHWKINGCSAIAEPGPASDGDIDAAWALLVAYDQWGSAKYLNDAKTLIGNIKTYETAVCDGLAMLRPGMWGSCKDGTPSFRVLVSSYFSPAYYRVFADVMNDPFWDRLAKDTYTTIDQGANSRTGLNPHTMQYNGKPGGEFGNHPSEWSVDAQRLPWRIALDYVYNGVGAADTYLTKVSNWANGIGWNNLRFHYALNGTAKDAPGLPGSSAWQSLNTMHGAVANAHMAVSQQRANSHASYLKTDRLKNIDGYYDACLRSIYLLQLTGNYWKPTRATGGGNGGGNGDKIIALKAPKTVTVGKMAQLTIQYEASTNRDIQAVFQLNKSPWTVYGSTVKKDVNAGKGTFKVNYLIPGNLPAAQNAYRFTVFITTNNGNWSNKLDSKAIVGVSTTKNGGGGNSPKTYQAESAKLNGMYVANSLAGFSGSGYADGMESDGDNVTFTVNVPNAGTYPLTIRYSLCNNQQNFVVINGKQTNHTFTDNSPGCGGWQNKQLNIALKAGNNTVAIKKNWGYMPVDYIIIGTRTGARISDVSNAHPKASIATVKQNPVGNDGLAIQLNGRVNQSTTISILDSRGAIVYKQTYYGQAEVNIPLAAFPGQGLYIAKIVNQLGAIEKKILVEH